jgi:hypothetical protein
MFQRIILTIILLSTIFTGVFALENETIYPPVPTLPHAFCGYITINNTPAPIGTTITVDCNHILQTNQSSITTTIEGEWGCNKAKCNALGPLLLVQGNIEPDEPITFFINNIKANVKLHNTDIWYQSLPFIPGGVSSIDLSINVQTNSTDSKTNTSNTTEIITTINPTPEPTPTITEYITATVTPTPTQNITNQTNETATLLPTYSSNWTVSDQTRITSMINNNETWIRFVGNYFNDMKGYWYNENYTPNWILINATNTTNHKLYHRIIKTIHYAENKSYGNNPDLNSMIDAQNWDWLSRIGINWNENGWTRFRIQEYIRYGLPSIYCPPDI